MKPKMLITGGGGDIAVALAQCAANNFEVYNPSRQVLDVTDKDNVFKYINLVSPDILINNAGYIVTQKIQNLDVSLWEREIQVNLLGTLYTCAAAVKANPKVKIINIGSSAAKKGKAGWSGYAASKAAVNNLTESMVEEGIDAHCLHIGRTQTKMRYNLCGPENPETLLTPQDVAEKIMRILGGKESGILWFNK